MVAAVVTGFLVLVPTDASAWVRASCTARWSRVAAPPAQTGQWFSPFWQGIAARASDDVWVVGSQDNLRDARRSVTVAGHWDGHAWTSASLPATHAVRSRLSGVAAAAADNVWAVGSRKTGRAERARTLAEHWDGKRWAIVPSPNKSNFGVNNLSAVAVLANDDVWAVGSSGEETIATRQPLLLHWNGARWTSTLQPQRGALDAIVAIAPNDVWATGVGENSDLSVTALTEHWNGRKWRVIPLRYTLTDPCSNCFVDLDHVTATASNDVWAAGYDGSEHSYVAHWNGRRWQSVQHPEFDGGAPAVRGLAAFARNDAWSAGTSSLQHWNGKAWTTTPITPQSGEVYGVIGGATSTDFWATTSAASYLHYAC